MAGYATGVSSNDEALREVLGGSEDEQLAVLGQESFDAVRNEYNFPVKCYRETRVAGPWNDWTELGLVRTGALLRDALADKCGFFWCFFLGPEARCQWSRRSCARCRRHRA